MTRTLFVGGIHALALCGLAACASPRPAAVAPVPPPAAAVPAPAAADMVLRGGRVFLADEANTVVQAVAVRDGRIIAAGTDEEVSRLVGEGTQVVKLAGRLVTPGFNDAHIHFASGGASLLNVNLVGTTSLAEIERRLAAGVAAAQPGEWVVGRGWDHTRLPREEVGPDGWPRRELLDRVAPDNPVFLTRVDGHVG
ncbi:MAG TPA: amidohydrolase family protein, partial [Longimicrobiaceae bacterium]|nr:amidohydrolase family protein [Longimicrobiaceae bacterium]